MTTLLITVALLMVGGGVFYLTARRAFSKKLTDSLNLALFSIRFPKRPADAGRVVEEIRVTEQFLGVLAAFKKPFAVEAAVPYVGEA
ncbi:MAG: hypothetical protein AAB368_09320, partial [bacterium]